LLPDEHFPAARVSSRNHFEVKIMSRLYKSIILVIVAFLGVSACDDTGTRGIDSKEVKEEIRNRTIKYITQPQIIDATFKRGQLIADTLQQALIRQMQKAVAENTLVEAAKYCNLQALPPYARLQEEHTATIKRIRLKGQIEGLSLNEMEKQLLDAYQYNQENKLPLENNVQKSGTEQMLFTSPILVNNTVCLKCHGKVEEQLTTQDYQSLQATYKMEGLVDYSVNQPIAIWSILFEKKALIKSLQAE
jgi:hypothetical protein